VTAIKAEAWSKVWKEALDALRREGWVTRRPGERGAFHHTSVKPFREVADPGGAMTIRSQEAAMSKWRADVDG
jgi:DNA-binding FadR family transcriptional regulator